MKKKDGDRMRDILTKRSTGDGDRDDEEDRWAMATKRATKEGKEEKAQKRRARAARALYHELRGETGLAHGERDEQRERNSRRRREDERPPVRQVLRGHVGQSVHAADAHGHSPREDTERFFFPIFVIFVQKKHQKIDFFSYFNYSSVFN